MNDVDYINLSTNDTTQNVTTTQLLSRVNLFYNTDNDYVGTYFKHYKDLTIDSNENTIQTLPTLHYHSYLDTLFDDHFSYSMDIKSNNYYRQSGVSAVQTDLNIPLTLQTSLFDEFLNVSYTSYLYAQHTSFKQKSDLAVNSSEYDNGAFARNYHQFNASTQLTRAFDELTHVVEIGTQYQIDGSDIENGYYEEQDSLFTPEERDDYCSLGASQLDPEYGARCDFYNITNIENRLQLYFSQYLYDVLGNQIIYHRVAQNISYENINGGAGEIENELDYQITDSLNFYNNMFYNYDESDFSKNFNKIMLVNGSFDFSLSHMYKKNFTSLLTTSYLTTAVDYKYDKHYSYSFKHDYDLERSEKKGFEVGFLYQKRCWDFGLRYVENNRPILGINGESNSIYDRYIYIVVRLKPIMSPQSKGTGFSYRLPDKSEAN